MPEPLSIFSAKFLYYESIENPTEILAETILKKFENPIPTSVFIVLYSHGFYIKGNLQHISREKRKSRSYQFISVDLLRKVYQCSFHNDFIIMVFYETLNQINEVILITFPFSLINECRRFHHYIQTLLNDKFCSMIMFDVLSSKYDNQYFNDIEMTDKKNEPIELEKPVSMSYLNKDKIQSLNLLNSLTFTDNSNKFDETTSEEIVDSSYLSDSSNDLNDVFLKRNTCEYQTPVKYSEKIQITDENIETFLEKTVYKTKRSSLFYDDQPETLNSIDSIETLENDDTDCNNCFENNSNSSFDQRDSFSFISNINEDFGNFNELSIADKKYLTNVNFPNQIQNRKLLESLNSIEDIKPNSLQSFDIFGNLINKKLRFQENNDRKLVKYSNFDNGFSDYNYDNNDNRFINHNLSKSQSKNMFCWPDFLKNETKFTTSILVEMSFSFHQLNNNWNLINKTDSLNDKISRKPLEWYEKVDRLHYNYNKKNFEIDENGSLIMYCCRQIGNDDENSD